MVMSQGTYTFLACFAGFWLVWALVVLLCCFCSFLQRRLKRQREERLREQCLRTVEMESLNCPGPGPGPGHPQSQSQTTPVPPAPAQNRETPQMCPSQAAVPLQVPHPLPQATWVTMPDSDVFGKPPCYEEAVLMEDPPPPYSEVLADPRGGTYFKPGTLRPAPHPVPAPISTRDVPHCPVYTETQSKPPPPPVPMFPDRGYSSLIRLPSSQRWDSLGHLLSNMDLNHNHLTTPPGVRSLHTATAMATMPRRDARTHHELRLQTGLSTLQGGTFQRFQRGVHSMHRLRGVESNYGLPTAFPLLGRSTAV